MKRNLVLNGVLAALFLTGAAFAQTQTPAETPSAEPAPETAPTEAGESEPAVDWTQRARAAFAANFEIACSPLPGDPPLSEHAPELFEHKYRPAYDAPEDPERVAVLYRFFCGASAYNENHVYYLHTGEELNLVSFAEPFLHVDYENEEVEGKVLGIKVVGLRAQNLLVNSTVEAKTLSITSANKWRGIGDASSSGVWLFKNGEYVLSTFEVDASYDGEINPEMVADYRAVNEALSETP